MGVSGVMRVVKIVGIFFLVFFFFYLIQNNKK